MRWLFRFADRQNTSVENILNTYSSNELKHWQVYCAKEPSDSEKSQFMMAQFMAMYYNSKQSKGRPLKQPKDFLISSHWKTEVEQDVDAIKKAFGLKK